ncbi:MAG TPA: zinc-ribbon domain-containing protein [Bryobacteraceae bacterium]|nr:zinc-ribbon domain-containing protein [Bryobacteraceae bacterium]
MPFCTNCGTAVAPSASYCVNCGQKQPPASAPPFEDLFHGMTDRTASLLCYIPLFGVIPAIVFLASRKFRTHARVRFDAFQSLYLFVAWLIVSSALPAFFIAPGWRAQNTLVDALEVLLLICWVYLLVKASQSEQVRLPLIGDLAARSAIEQL